MNEMLPLDKAGNGTESDKITNEITVLVFKDGLVSRTFQVPLRWISSLGLVVTSVVAITLISIFLAFKFYNASSRVAFSNPARLHDLESQISNLKNQLNSVPAPAVIPIPVAPAVIAPTAPLVASQPVPTITVTVTATPPPVPVNTAPLAAARPGAPLVFSALPPQIEPVSSTAPKTLAMDSPEISWQGKTLNVQFNLQFTGPDKGNQQGRIIILARGPDSLLAYPDGVLTVVGSESLIAPEQGEYFSVSHFRAVKAQFGPVRSREVLREVEVLIIGQTGELLIHEKLLATVQSTSKSIPKPTPKPTPSSNSSGAPQ